MNDSNIKDQKIGAYEMSKVYLSSFDDKKYIQDIRYEGSALGY